MKKRLIILSGTILIISFGQTINSFNSTQKPMTAKQIDTAVIAVIPFESSVDQVNYLFKCKCKSANLTTQDLSDIANLLTDCIDNYNPNQEKKFYEINKDPPQINMTKTIL
jgi:L-asparaginase/Glu-tRNA(Gln) amidotransferase subunit D